MYTNAEVYLDPTFCPLRNTYFIFTDKTGSSTKNFILGAFKLVSITGEEREWVLSESENFEEVDDTDQLVVHNPPFRHMPKEGKFLLGKDILEHIDFSRIL